MAEVLITLGIIGIVAAITLPTLIGNHQKKQTALQLKKFYSIMSQAILRAEADYESFEYWDFGNNNNTIEFAKRYFVPYLNIIKTYEPRTFPADLEYSCLNGNNCNAYGDIENNPKFVLIDGTMITSFDYATGGAASKNPIINIIVDLNGFKKPNKFGRDVFMFSMQKEHGFVPYGIGYISNFDDAQTYDRERLLSAGDERNCNRSKNGIFCAAVIMMDGWEIKDDYPW